MTNERFRDLVTYTKKNLAYNINSNKILYESDIDDNFSDMNDEEYQYNIINACKKNKFYFFNHFIRFDDEYYVGTDFSHYQMNPATLLFHYIIDDDNIDNIVFLHPRQSYVTHALAAESIWQRLFNNKNIEYVSDGSTRSMTYVNIVDMAVRNLPHFLNQEYKKESRTNKSLLIPEKSISIVDMSAFKHVHDFSIKDITHKFIVDTMGFKGNNSLELADLIHTYKSISENRRLYFEEGDNVLLDLSYRQIFGDKADEWFGRNAASLLYDHDLIDTEMLCRII